MPDDAISDCSKSISYDNGFLKALHRRAQLYEEKDELDKALADYKEILDKDPSNVAAMHNAMVISYEYNQTCAGYVFWDGLNPNRNGRKNMYD